VYSENKAHLICGVIEVFYLPSYSPELNPDELLNADLKKRVTSTASAKTKTSPAKAHPLRFAVYKGSPNGYRNTSTRKTSAMPHEYDYLGKCKKSIFGAFDK
jgi:transposase